MEKEEGQRTGLMGNANTSGRFTRSCSAVSTSATSLFFVREPVESLRAAARRINPTEQFVHHTINVHTSCAQCPIARKLGPVVDLRRGRAARAAGRWAKAWTAWRQLRGSAHALAKQAAKVV